VGGRSLGLIVNYAPMPSARRRLTWSLGAGVDYYSVGVENYFDEGYDAGFPEDQPSRFSRSTDSTYGLQLRGSLDYYLVHDVSIQLGVIGRWVSPIEVEGISLTHPSPDLSRSLAAHSVDLSSVHLSIGLGMGF
jgi:hypothetical protein